jgi:excisionase family DNA binding protein
VSFTYSTAEAAQQMGAPSERWLVEQLRAGRFRGRKVGRQWRMTEQDVLDALDICSNDRLTIAGSAASTGLTPRSKKRIAGT